MVDTDPQASLTVRLENPIAPGEGILHHPECVDLMPANIDNYGVTPDHYEDLGHGIYQVYVEMNGNVVPFVTVDSATGDYHG